MGMKVSISAKGGFYFDARFAYFDGGRAGGDL
jgi:hypothetical protein